MTKQTCNDCGGKFKNLGVHRYFRHGGAAARKPAKAERGLHLPTAIKELEAHKVKTEEAIAAMKRLYQRRTA
jgi:hypothetical protein